jgi:hypothetical protein
MAMAAAIAAAPNAVAARPLNINSSLIFIVVSQPEGSEA